METTEQNGNRYFPPDYKEWEKYGTCGESCICVLLKYPSVEAQANFQNQQYGHIWTNVRDMLDILKPHFNIKKQRGKKGKVLPEPQTKQALVCIQWLKDDGTEFYWAESQKYSHWVLMQKEEDGWWIWDNGFGWLKKDEWLKVGFHLGYIRSFMELTPIHSPSLKARVSLGASESLPTLKGGASLVDKR